MEPLVTHLTQYAQSRRDGTLLTVGFNLRRLYASRSEVPQGRHSYCAKVSSLRDLGAVLCRLNRRLKSTVNKGLSLRDRLLSGVDKYSRPTEAIPPPPRPIALLPAANEEVEKEIF